MKFDYLFSSRGTAGNSRHNRNEPHLAAAQGGLPALATIDDGAEPLSTPLSPKLRLGLRADPRSMSPRQLADWAHEMYLCRMLNWDEYCMAGFPAELHPHYNRTVGALTGNVAQPDAPRNMIRVWEDRLAFALRYNEPDEPEVLRTEKLLQLLRSHVPPTIGGSRL